MSTKSEFCDWQDTLPDSHLTLDYHEQVAVMEEFEEMRNTALKQQGAREALKSLESFLLYCGAQERTPSHYLAGLKWAIDSIGDRIKELGRNPELEGGAI
jgi:hypothetical protein